MGSVAVDDLYQAAGEVFCMSLTLRYLTTEAFAALPDIAAQVLGAAGFGTPRPLTLELDCPFLGVALPPIDGSALLEVWSSDGPVERGAHGDFRFSHDGTHLFGMIQREAGGDLATVTRSLYDQLFALAEDTGYPHLMRIFNYLPGITRVEAGQERYRRFNEGRHEAFAAQGRVVEAAPAACALGSAGDLQTLYFIAARKAGQPLENPRQISAYRYPTRYGPRSPTFSRALVARDEAGAMLFLSGTASIVSHESQHPGDPAAQLAETLRNLRALLTESRRRGYRFEERDLVLKAYLRRPEDRALVERGLAEAGIGRAPILLRAEICRAELLLEIEGYARGEALE
jgi:chorismate lyase/3-hydroxybenzoate synthase